MNGMHFVWLKLSHSSNRPNAQCMSDVSNVCDARCGFGIVNGCCSIANLYCICLFYAVGPHRAPVNVHFS